MKCFKCEEDLEIITKWGGMKLSLQSHDHKTSERVSLYVCTSRDCENCGIVVAIPWTNKDEEE